MNTPWNLLALLTSFRRFVASTAYRWVPLLAVICRYRMGTQNGDAGGQRISVRPYLYVGCFPFQQQPGEVFPRKHLLASGLEVKEAAKVGRPSVSIRWKQASMILALNQGETCSNWRRSNRSRVWTQPLTLPDDVEDLRNQFTTSFSKGP